jgi:LysM repeat protein
VLPLPSEPAAQAQLEKLVEQNRQLQQQVDSLQDTLKQWNTWYANQMAADRTNQIVPQTEIASQPTEPATQVQMQQPIVTQPVVTQPVEANPVHSEGTGTSAHTHVVERGETAMAICRKYGIRLSELEIDNPSMNPSRIHVGQILNIP